MSNIRARLSSTTPFGIPVVPPVYIRIPRSDSSGSDGTVGEPAATTSSYSKSWGTSPLPIRTTLSMPASARTESIIGAKKASAKQTRLPESLMMKASSFGARRRLSGLMTLPPSRLAW